MEQTPAKRVWESVQLYSVDCSKCWKWRLVPTKERYEQIREKNEEQPFTCEMAREWRPEVSCEDESDINKQDENLCWAMDVKCLPQTPPAWERLIRTRAQGSTKFADVYYVSPSNKRLRSMPELKRYLDEHPEYAEQGVNASRFSFQAPSPLNKNYVSKRGVRASSSSDVDIYMAPIEALVAPNENFELHSGEPYNTSTEVRSPPQS